jgi:outer membrane protein assembly factor BamD
MKRALIILCILTLCSGCNWLKSWFASPEKEEFAQELIFDGMEQYRKGNYKTAIAKFEKLKDWYPFSKYAILAELKIADSYYHSKEFEEAVFAYEEFENLHPQNEATPYVVYQIGRCYFDQITTPDRDQTQARKALDTFNRLLRQFPESEYAELALDHINESLKSMAESEYLIGVFYYNSKHYKGALARFQNVIGRYPDVGVHRKALKYIILCESRIAAEELE